MGNKSEEVQIQNEIDELEDEEIKINLEIYKLQMELNKRLPITNINILFQFLKSF